MVFDQVSSGIDKKKLLNENKVMWLLRRRWSNSQARSDILGSSLGTYSRIPRQLRSFQFTSLGGNEQHYNWKYGEKKHTNKMDPISVKE